MIYLELFLSFLQIGLFSVGGGYVAMPLIQSQTVTLHSWLTMGEFTDLVTIAEMTPGPIGINAATFVGQRVAGFPGALAATFGCILPSCILVSLLALLYGKYKQLTLLQSILGTLRPVVVALIAGAGITMLLQVIFGGQGFSFSAIQWLGLALFAGAFTLLRTVKWNPMLVMALCGVLSLCVGLLVNI